MKLMTLNTHSLVESSYEEKKEKFIETLIVEQPDVVALQEVNQTASAGKIPEKKECITIGPGCLQRSDMENTMKEWLFYQRNRL